MSNFTFQKLWKLTFGQYINGVFTEVFNLTEHRFSADINFTSKSTAGSETANMSTISLYNIGYEFIGILSKYEKLAVEVKAGYLYNNGTKISRNNLPVVYLGDIVSTSNKIHGTDVVTTLKATPALNKFTKTVSNFTYKTNATYKDVLDRLASDANIPIVYKIPNENTSSSTLNTSIHQATIPEKFYEKLKVSTTVEGSTVSKISEWCYKVGLKSYIEDETLYIIPANSKVSSSKVHFISAGMTKGIAEVSKDITKTSREQEDSSPTVKVETFLYPYVKLSETVEVEITDFTKDQNKTKSFIKEIFTIQQYSHKMDSHGASWTTYIEGKSL